MSVSGLRYRQAKASGINRGIRNCKWQTPQKAIGRVCLPIGHAKNLFMKRLTAMAPLVLFV